MLIDLSADKTEIHSLFHPLVCCGHVDEYETMLATIY